MVRKRVLFLIEGIHTSGAITSINKIINNIDKNKYSIIVGSESKGVMFNQLQEQNVDITLLNLNFGKELRLFFHSKFKFLFLFKIIFAFIHDVLLIRRFISKTKVDIIHTHYLHHHIITCFTHTKVKTIWHLRSFINKSNFFGLGFKFFCFLLKRIPHQVISISESIKDQYPKGLKERIKVIYNGINISDLREPNLEDFYKRLGTNRKDIVVGAVGRFNFIKGFHVYIEAIRLIQKDISNVCFVLIGPDNIEYEKEYLDEIKNMIKNKGLNKKVFILGAFKKANMFMNALDILVLPTVSNEGFGNVVLEAQAIGIPVIASNCGGPNEVVRDKISGYIVEKNNPKAIAVKLLKLLKDSNTRMEMAQRAKDENFINKFSLKNSIAMIEDVYNNL